MNPKEIKRLIRKLVIEAVNQNMPSRSDLDAGVMKAVNVEGLYPEVTLQMNRMGHIHMWKGNVEPIQISKYNYAVDGKESDVYIQNDSDVKEILKSLRPEEEEELEKGWPVVTTNISDEYFGLHEMSSTGGVAGYSTPFAFSRKKEGSSRAIAAAKKYGKVVKSISEDTK